MSEECVEDAGQKEPSVISSKVEPAPTSNDISNTVEPSSDELSNKTESTNTSDEMSSTGSPGSCQYSDNQSDACSSDSGKYGAQTAAATDATDPELELAVISPWHIVSSYSGFTAYSEPTGSVIPGHPMIYEFEIPQTIVGRLIGKYGSFVNKIKHTTGANIIVKRHNSCVSLKICAVEGYSTEIEDAIAMIRERFPEKKFSYLTLEQINRQKLIPSASAISFISPNNKLGLIEGVVNDVSVCCVSSLDNLFLQQPTHPTFPALARLRRALMAFYEEAIDAPKLVQPFYNGVICVARGKNGEWYRAEVVSLNDAKDEATIRLLDDGGYMEILVDDLRQIRVDFLPIPFQATECRLFGVTPLEKSDDLTSAARDYFDEICKGQILQAHVIGYAIPDNEPLVYLYRINEKQMPILVNQELAEKGLVTWIDHNTTSDEAAGDETA